MATSRRAPADFLSDLLIPGQTLRDAGDGVWSVFPGEVSGDRYARRARGYDAVVGSRIYNRIMWGSSPASYAAFARAASASSEGPMLDAGCGSLVFTADVHAGSKRPLVLVDRSLGMLRATRARVLVDGRVPDRIALIQADACALPFRSASFSTVLSMNLLHLFDDPGPAVSSLVRILTGRGQLFATSLVTERAIGRWYLALLHAAGEMGVPKTAAQVRTAIEQPRAVSRQVTIATEGSMAFVTARKTSEEADR